MKKQLFILAVLSIALFSCKSNNDVETLVTVKLNPSFISLNEGSNEPMKVKGDGLMKMNSATAADSVIYAIQVYENDAPSYYGLFNDVSKMQLALTTSKTYKFKVSAYKIGTGKGLNAVVDTAGTNYFLPTKTPLKNKFIKGDALKDIDLASSIGMNIAAKAYPEVDAFYATKTLTLDKGTTSVDFTLLRMGFGINFTVDALTSGNMEIYLGNDTIRLNSAKTSAYTVRQFATSTNTFTNINTSAATFGDSITITAKWTSTSGTTVTAAGKYKFLRNYQKTINIQLNTTTNGFNFEGWGTIADIDGNIYHTVTIGTQTWMVENLKTTKYNDGTTIPNVTAANSWQPLTTPAYCWGNNDIANKDVYGALYNWYAASNSKLAPTGWHVATSTEWNTLLSYLGGSSVAGSKLKESGTTHWKAPNTGTNETGFTALPSGQRIENGVYNLDGTLGIWWTSSASGSLGTYVNMGYSTAAATPATYYKYDGFAVRCIRD
ncbi:MAG: fibrobacter succinogenes major paralogous domain-containing protein [Paludibacter sp.]|nr:fibrobacter succinogenes major paralogous domain-containing protein [Paludibacter sp.]